MAVYEPLPMFKQAEGCWSVIDKRKMVVCGSKEGAWYQLDSKTSNVGPGITVKVRLCPKHRNLAARYYVVTPVTAP